MRNKNFHFKFMKKKEDDNKRTKKLRGKNYSNIFNRILSGEKQNRNDNSSFENGKKLKNTIKNICKFEISKDIEKNMNNIEKITDKDKGKILPKRKYGINFINKQYSYNSKEEINGLKFDLSIQKESEKLNYNRIPKLPKNPIRPRLKKFADKINNKDDKIIYNMGQNYTTLKTSPKYNNKTINNNRNYKTESVKSFENFEKKNPTLSKNKEKNKKIFTYNYLNKITITNDELNSKKNIDYSSDKHTKNDKKLILNNTNSNINININITNINERGENKKRKNIKIKTNESNSLVKKNTEYKRNITTVNIINNDSRIKHNNLGFYYLGPKKTKINSKGIKIESININLGEDVPSKKNSAKKKAIKDKKRETIHTISEENEIKDSKSLYELFQSPDDILSNKSLTNFSCKTGFSASRKFRSLNREREKKKMKKSFRDTNSNYIKKMSDKLLNIVNDFHKNNSSRSKEKVNEKKLYKKNIKNKRYQFQKK